jgi:hypothetical protein
VQGFANAAFYKKESLISQHFKLAPESINSIEQISLRERNPHLVNAAIVVLFPLSIGFYLTAGDCERSCSKASKAVGVIKYQVDFTNNLGQRCDALVKIKGKVSGYTDEFKRMKVKTLKMFCNS